MSLGAKMVEPWLLVSNDVKVRTEKRIKPDVKAKKTKGWLEQADHFVLVQKRHFYGLHSFSDDAGAESGGGFSLNVGGGATLTITRTSERGSPKWICTSDRLEITDHITGEGWETQTWELQSKYEPVPESYYEEPIPEEPGPS